MRRGVRRREKRQLTDEKADSAADEHNPLRVRPREHVARSSGFILAGRVQQRDAQGRRAGRARRRRAVGVNKGRRYVAATTPSPRLISSPQSEGDAACLVSTLRPHVPRHRRRRHQRPPPPPPPSAPRSRTSEEMRAPNDSSTKIRSSVTVFRCRCTVTSKRWPAYGSSYNRTHKPAGTVPAQRRHSYWSAGVPAEPSLPGARRCHLSGRPNRDC